MRFPAGGPVPVGVWREAPSPPHPVTAAGTRGPEKRQGSADQAQLRPVAATLFAFASNANFARGRAICPPADCGVCGCYAFAVLISISKFCLPRTDLRYQGSLISHQESAAAAIVRLRAAEGLALSRSSRPAFARILSFRAGVQTKRFRRNHQIFARKRCALRSPLGTVRCPPACPLPSPFFASHEIVMVIAIGKKSPGHIDQPQWRRPLESTVTIL